MKSPALPAVLFFSFAPLLFAAPARASALEELESARASSEASATAKDPGLAAQSAGRDFTGGLSSLGVATPPAQTKADKAKRSDCPAVAGLKKGFESGASAVGGAILDGPSELYVYNLFKSGTEAKVKRIAGFTLFLVLFIPAVVIAYLAGAVVGVAGAVSETVKPGSTENW